jgi:hypothetical protein
MGHVAEPLMLNEVLTAAAQLTHDERRGRILECVTATGRHDHGSLPVCREPATQQLLRYCDRCWSVIDGEGLTWSWPPSSE